MVEGKLNQIFDMSKVHLSQAYSYAQGDKGAYLKIDWLGRPTYWREDEEGWGTRYSGRLDERAHGLYNDFLKERDNHKYRIDYAVAATKLEKGYVEFYKQLENGSSCQSVLWKMQVLSSKFFSWLSGASRKGKDAILFHPMGAHSPFYHATLTTRFKVSELEAAGLLKREDMVKDFAPAVLIQDNGLATAHYLPLEENETERSVAIEFDYEVWKQHAESRDATILDTYKSKFLAKGIDIFDIIESKLSAKENESDTISQTPRGLRHPPFMPTVEPEWMTSQELAYVGDCCLEAGLTEQFLQDVYVVGCDTLMRQELRVRWKPGVQVTRAQVASLCILKYLQAGITEHPPKFLSQLDASSLHRLSQKVSQLTEQEIADLKTAFGPPGKACPANLLDIVKGIRAQARTLQDSPRFLEAFGGLPLPMLFTHGFIPEAVELLEPDISGFENKKYVKNCCFEAGLTEQYLQTVYASDALMPEPMYQQIATRLKPDVILTRLQVASLCILKHLQAKTKEGASDFLLQLDECSLQELSQKVALLTEQEIRDLKNSLSSPRNTYPVNLSDIFQGIQAQAKVLRDNSRFLEAFFDLPLPRKPATEISPGFYQLHIPNIADYPK